MHIFPKVSVCLCLRVSTFSRKPGEVGGVSNFFFFLLGDCHCSFASDMQIQVQILEFGKETSISQVCVTANYQSIPILSRLASEHKKIIIFSTDH